MFSLVGFDCKGQVIPSALLPVPYRLRERLEAAVHIRSGCFPAPAQTTSPFVTCPLQPALPSQTLRSPQSTDRKGLLREPGLQEKRNVSAVVSQAPLGPQLPHLACTAHTTLFTRGTNPADPFLPPRLLKALFCTRQ